jgi:hypothetical protein
MIDVVCGRKSKSADLLREKLEDVEVEGTLHWGTEGDGVGGQVKLDAVQQFEKLRAAGLTVPDWYLSAPFHFLPPVHGVYIGRCLKHSQGRDIILPGKPGSSEFWVGWVPSFNEWRIHVWKKRVIARGIKHYVGTKAMAKYPIRSRRKGWRLRHDIDPPQAVRDAARKAVAALGYDFGAVDILIRDPDDAIVILEVNSAPGLDNYTADRYVKAITRTFKRRNSE